MVSNCQAKNWRNQYIEGLSGVMPVDNYGKCHRNKFIDPDLEAKFGIRNGDYSHYGGEFIKLKQSIISDYPFFLAFENSNCYDYVTEKPYDAFLGGAIPIYMGAPNVDEYLPANSFIDARGKTPVQMAHLLKKIIQNQTLFLSFHRWRLNPSQTALKLAPMESDTSVCQAVEQLRSKHCPVT
jgi:alpha-1,3-fucosyltransferase 10